MTKHTPGPWTFLSIKYGEGAVDEYQIVALGKRDIGYMDHAPDARLVAAAPELLVALKLVDEMLPLLTRTYTREEARAIMRAAIAKAEGK